MNFPRSRPADFRISGKVVAAGLVEVGGNVLPGNRPEKSLPDPRQPVCRLSFTAIYDDLDLHSANFGLRSHERDLRHVARVWQQHERVARAALQALENHMRAALEICDARMTGRIHDLAGSNN